ncbi:MAG: DUF1080 domain-containing protein [Cytophagales bacterium]|nr:DUF1080 domain-containing protein [Cytophagales bacterium]
MRQKVVVAVSLILFGYLNGVGQEINKLTKEEKKEGWKLLFNGKNLSGWKTFNAGNVTGWKVVDGILHNSGKGSDHGGDIITGAQYENFELYLEWNISALSNSGVFIRVQEKVVDAIYKTGPEYQLCDDEGVEKVKKRNKNQYTASCYAMYEAVGAELQPLGKWNVTRIVVNGSSVEHWLNGKKVVEYELWGDDWRSRKENSKWKEHEHYGISKKGHIGLQDHGGLTRFRNVKIKKL